MTLYELLHRDIQRMITGIGRRDKGNIHPLIMQEIEKYIIQIALEETKHNYVVTARLLGIGRSTLYRKIRKFKLQQKQLTAE
jgi:transcriptional regulator of acetoin/glycerol metabolism